MIEITDWEVRVGAPAPADPAATARLLAALPGQDPATLRALAAGVDLDARDARGWTPLTQAAYYGLPRACAILLDLGADPDRPAGEAGGHTGWTPLMVAACHGWVEVAAVLLARGADPRTRGPHGETAADIAAERVRPMAAHDDHAEVLALVERHGGCPRRWG